ncbi:hypothetical protein Tco_1239358 [Tanacetum coccineum]
MLRISRPQITQDPTRNGTIRKVIDIQNLDGMIVPTTICNEMVKDFDVKKYESMEKLVIIAVNSCRVTNKYGGLQLTATPTTYYYLNPNVPEASQITDIPEAFTVVADCNELLNGLKNKDPLQLPPSIKALEGITHTFQFRFNSGSKPGNSY